MWSLKIKSLIFFLLAAFFMLVLPQAVIAGTSISTLAVKAHIIPNINVNSSDILDFGSFYAGSSNVDAIANIEVVANSGSIYTIRLNGGGYSSGMARRLTDGFMNYLNYYLYEDDSRSNSWDIDESVSKTGSGSLQVTSVFGRIPAIETDMATGEYLDTITITVTF